jgi:4-amino-4-deoxy-L-arabinose transferase-like glycosyltransferase
MTLTAMLRGRLSSSGAVPWLFALFLVPRLAVALLDVTPVSDALWYFARATDVSAGLGYSEGGVPTAYWPPGWPLTLAMLFTAFGPSMAVVKGFNLICAAITAWLTLDLARRLFGSELAGRAALLLVALYPNSIGYVPLALTEVFYTALLLGGCWLLIATQSAAGLVLGGLVFGIAVLVKAQSLLVVPLIFAIVWLRKGGRARALVYAGVRCVVVLCVAVAVMAPWTWRNFQVFGEVVPVSTNGGMTLLTGNNPSARGGYTEDDPLVTTIPRTVATQLQVDREARARAEQWIKDNPTRFVALMPLKLFRLWAPDGEAEWAYQDGYPRYETYRLVFRAIRGINQIYYTALLLGFLLAGVLLFFRRAAISPMAIDWWALPYAMVLFPTVIAVVFSGQSRFHYPVMPFIAMSCGWLLTRQTSTTE